MVYSQPNSWQCGPFALKHALLMWGRAAHEDDLARLAGSSESTGTDERGLAAAAGAQGAALRVIRRRSAGAARRTLAHWLARGIPVLLCVDQWDHWITAVADLGDRVALFDSHFDNAVFRTEPWDRLLARLVYRERRWGGLWERRWYDLHPVQLTVPAPVRRLTPQIVRSLLTAPEADVAVARVLASGAPPVLAGDEQGEKRAKILAGGPPRRSPSRSAPFASARQHHRTRTV